MKISVRHKLCGRDLLHMAGLLHPQRVDLPRGERAQVKPSAAVGDAPLFRNAGGFGDGKHQRIRAGETLIRHLPIDQAMTGGGQRNRHRQAASGLGRQVAGKALHGQCLLLRKKLSHPMRFYGKCS